MFFRNEKIREPLSSQHSCNAATISNTRTATSGNRRVPSQRDPTQESRNLHTPQLHRISTCSRGRVYGRDREPGCAEHAGLSGNAQKPGEFDRMSATNVSWGRSRFVRVSGQHLQMRGEGQRRREGPGAQLDKATGALMRCFEILIDMNQRLN